MEHRRWSTAPAFGLPLIVQVSLVLDFLFLVLLAGCVVSWDFPVDRSPGPRVDLPLVSSHWRRSEDDIGRVFVSVTREGQVWFGAERVAIDRIGELLRGGMHNHLLRRRARGQGPVVEVAAGKWLSSMTVVLRADRNTPWGAVHAVLRRIGEEGVFKISVVVVRAAWGRYFRTELPAYLPLDIPLPGESVIVRIVQEPSGICYYLGDRLYQDPGGLRTAIAAARTSSDAHVSASFHAGPDTRFEVVVSALEALLEAEVWKVDLNFLGDPELLVVAVLLV